MDKAINSTARPDACPKGWISEGYEPGLVSVIVPTYNRASLIAETLESVRAQTYRPVEIVVVDDGSTDDTALVVQEFAGRTKGDLEVRYLHQENQGPSAARNRGLLESRGEFIQFLDSDDLLHPDKLSAQVGVMRQEADVQFVFSGWKILPKGGLRTPRWWRKDFNPDRQNLLDLLFGADNHQILPLWTANGIYRRSLCQRLGPWDTEQKGAMDDFLYNIRMFTLPASYRYVPAIHAWARQHSGGQITDQFAEPDYLANTYAGYEKMRRHLEDAGLFGRRRQWLLCRAYYQLARPALIAGATRLGMKLLDEAISIAPPSAARLKLLTTRLLYRTLGTACANRLFDVKMQLAGAMRRALGSVGPLRHIIQGPPDELDDSGV